MKKTATMILSLALTATMLAGCGSAAPTASPNANSTGKILKIGVVQIMEHPSLDQIRTSFLEELNALGYDESRVEIDYKNASGDQSNLNSICQNFAGTGKDLIVAIATPSAQAAAAAAPKIPLVFSAVTDPVAAKLITDPQKPDGIITGTSDAIPVEQVFALMKQLTPEVKTVGMIYNQGEVNSVSVIKTVKAYCDTNGLQYTEATVTNPGEVQQAALSLIGKCEAIYSPIDNTVASAMPALSGVAREAKIPVYTGADSMVIDGGLATVGVNYIQLGKQTAAMAAKVLEGIPIAEIPVETLCDFSATINETTAAALGISIPKEILTGATVVK